MKLDEIVEMIGKSVLGHETIEAKAKLCDYITVINFMQKNYQYCTYDDDCKTFSCRLDNFIILAHFDKDKLKISTHFTVKV
ncbi:MAG: hypothetical protein QXV58_15085 [Saccharolobus sp.]|uniref:hypothetical protein n=1 Tax=Saccharolobus sp. TaxID=2100761 RepID=UPI003169DC85